MIRICSYCRAVLGEKEPLEDKRVSHGVCETCYNEQVQKLMEAAPEVAVEETPTEMPPIVFVCGCTYGKGKYISRCFKHSDSY